MQIFDYLIGKVHDCLHLILNTSYYNMLSLQIIADGQLGSFSLISRAYEALDSSRWASNAHCRWMSWASYNSAHGQVFVPMT